MVSEKVEKAFGFVVYFYNLKQEIILSCLKGTPFLSKMVYKT